MDQGFAGGFIWSIETDDFNNLCGDGPFPLLTAIQDVLNGGFQTPPADWTTPAPGGGDSEDRTTSAPGSGGGDDRTTSAPGSGDGGDLPPATELCDGSQVGPQPHPSDCSEYYVI